jgi:hypothetical protein
LDQIFASTLVLAAGLGLLTGFHVVFVGRIISALVSLVSILVILLARLVRAFVAARVWHDDSP